MGRTCRAAHRPPRAALAAPARHDSAWASAVSFGPDPNPMRTPSRHAAETRPRGAGARLRVGDQLVHGLQAVPQLVGRQVVGLQDLHAHGRRGAIVICVASRRARHHARAHTVPTSQNRTETFLRCGDALCSSSGMKASPRTRSASATPAALRSAASSAAAATRSTANAAACSSALPAPAPPRAPGRRPARVMDVRGA